MKQKGILYTSASAILFGIAPLLTVIVYREDVSSMTTVFYRALFAVIMLAVLCKYKHISFALSKRQLLDIAIAALLGSGLTTILLFMSYEYIDTGTATSLHFLYPIFVALMCRMFFHEHLGMQKCLSLLLAFVSMLFFLSDAKQGGMLGYITAIASSITYAFYMVYLDKRGLTKIPSFLLSLYLNLFLVFETLLCHGTIAQITFILTPKAYLYSILLSLCGSLLAVVWLQKGIHYLGSTTASLFCLFEPITSLIIGVLFLEESFTIAKLLASCLIILALIGISIPLPSRPKKQAKPSEEEAMELSVNSI